MRKRALCDKSKWVMMTLMSRSSVRVPIAYLKAHLAEALREVEAGQQIVVERRGKPVAVLVPPTESAVSKPWWRELYGIVGDTDGFGAVMNEIVRGRKNARPRPVDLEG